MRFRRKIGGCGLKAHPIILKTYLIPAILLIMTLALTVTESAAAGHKRIVVLDFPDLKWSEISESHPQLTYLLSTGSVGLVKLPATLTNKKFALPVISESYSRRSTGFYEEVVSKVCSETDFNNTLLLIYARRSPEIENGLTPILLKGAGFNGGVLYSPGTRKRGIVTYNDLRSTMLQFLNRGKFKPVFQIRPQPGDWRRLIQSRQKLIRNYILRWPLLTGYFYLLLGVILLLLTGLGFRFRQRIITGLAWGYLFLITIPATFLLEAIIDPLDWSSILLSTIGINGALFLGSYLISRGNFSRTVLWVSLITAGLVIGDALLNGSYECKSFLGYSLVSGARFYGIGNEYMGILLGSVITVLSLIVSDQNHDHRKILWLTALGSGFILIHPNLGSDVGGGITALMGLGVANYLWLKQPIRVREIIRLGLIALTVLIIAGTWDFYANRDCMSHLGQLLIAVINHGPKVLSSLAIRKISLNLRLIGATPLTLVLLGLLSAIPFLYRFPTASLQRLMDKYPETAAGLTGLAVTALIGFLLNDSGIVSAAMIFMFGVGLVLTVILKELNEASFNGDE